MSRSKTKGASNSYHHGDLRAALLRAAWDLLREEGLDGLSLRAVARRAGVSYQAPYHHFADKGALLFTMAAEGYSALTEALLQSTRGVSDPLARIQCLGRVYVRFALEDPARFRLMNRPELPGSSATPLPGDSAQAVLRSELELGQHAQKVVPGDVRGLTLSCWAMVHGLATLLVDGLPISESELDRTVAASTSHLIKGIEVRLE